jgi:hypothetical protein
MSGQTCRICGERYTPERDPELGDDESRICDACADVAIARWGARNRDWARAALLVVPESMILVREARQR